MLKPQLSVTPFIAALYSRACQRRFAHTLHPVEC
jgi:hypothetical protein